MPQLSVLTSHAIRWMADDIQRSVMHDQWDKGLGPDGNRRGHHGHPAHTLVLDGDQGSRRHNQSNLRTRFQNHRLVLLPECSQGETGRWTAVGRDFLLRGSESSGVASVCSSGSWTPGLLTCSQGDLEGAQGRTWGGTQERCRLLRWGLRRGVISSGG